MKPTMLRIGPGTPEAAQAWEIVSNLDEAGNYLEWCRTIECLCEEVYVAQLDRQIVGVLVALPADWNYLRGEFTWSNQEIEKDLRKNGFVYVHQVAVRPEHRGRGVATELYRHLSELYPGCPQLLFIRHEPYNRVSACFHAAQGFIPVGKAITPGTKAVVEGWFRNILNFTRYKSCVDSTYLQP